MKSKRGGSFLGFVLGLAIGGVCGAVLAHKYFVDQAARHDQIARDERALDNNPRAPGGAPAVERATDSRENTEEYLQRKLRDWNLTPDDLKRELGQAGDVIKREGKKIGATVSDAAGDLRIIAAIKAKYTRDKELSGWDISVGSKDGRVTLGGTVKSPEQIGRAIAMAVDTEGVVDVTSRIRVEAK